MFNKFECTIGLVKGITCFRKGNICCRDCDELLACLSRKVRDIKQPVNTGLFCRGKCEDRCAYELDHIWGE